MRSYFLCHLTPILRGKTNCQSTASGTHAARSVDGLVSTQVLCSDLTGHRWTAAMMSEMICAWPSQQ
eukprot:5816628-Pyramimonas_sp.AAC.1